MYPSVKDRSFIASGITTVNTDYSFSLNANPFPPTTSATSKYLTNGFPRILAKDRASPENTAAQSVEIEKVPQKIPYYPSNPMFSCTGSRLLAKSGNKERPFDTVEHGGQPKQFYAPYSRGGVRIFQNPSLTSSSTLATPGPKQLSGCVFSIPPVTRKMIFPCVQSDSNYGIFPTKNTNDKKHLFSSMNKPSLSGRFRGYRGVVALSGTQISRDSSSTSIHFKRSLPIPTQVISRKRPSRY